MEQDFNFEEAVAELEKIAQELENGKLNLDDAIKKFEDGMELSKKCTDYLEKAEKKINVLVDKNGELIEEKFEN